MLKRIFKYFGKAVIAWFTGQLLDATLKPWFEKHFSKIKDTSAKVNVAVRAA